MLMMSDFTYDKDSVWDEGKLYDHKEGGTYIGLLILKDKNSIDLRGYIDFSLSW